MKVRFTKMHGTGNDFMVIDGVRQSVDLTPPVIRHLGDRHFGVGFDQLLLVEPPDDPAKHRFRYRIFNADGSEVEQCGNGARCFALFVQDQKLTADDILPVETLAGTLVLQILENRHVRVNMGAPRFSPADIPLDVPAEADGYRIATDHPAYPFVEIGAVSMGNPHALLVVAAVDTAPVDTLGPLLEQHPCFPKRVNAGFVALRNREAIDLRVFERGVGETLACGSGAAAAMAILRRRNRVDSRITVHLPGGDLVLSWDGLPEEPIWLTGPATTVFEGTIEL